MKVKVIRGGRRIVGWGDLPEPGAVVIVPDDLAAQLIEQSLVTRVSEREPKQRRPDRREEN